MRQAALLAAALLSVRCAPVGAPLEPGGAESEAAIPRQPQAAEAPKPTAENHPSSDEQLLQSRIGAALAYVSEVRQLAVKAPVRGRLIGRAAIERYLVDQLNQETPTELIEATEAVLYGFGTVAQDFDYRASLIELMSSQLLGFYDPKQKTFFVGGQLKGEEADATLWHELVHALQDQHYDLTHLMDWEPDLGDSQAAVHALAEGDATSAMLDAMLKPRGTTALDVPEGLLRAQTVLGSASLTAPPVLVRSLLAPYVDGLAFTNYLRRRGGFAAVDEAWRAPPISTEQLLHPEKFLAQEPPMTVPVPRAPPNLPELVERFHDVMGEQTLRILLEEWLPARTAAAAAADWGGDRLAVFADDGRKRWAIGWHLRFDSRAAADRAFTAFVRAAPATERIGNGAGAVEAAQPRAHLGDKLCRPRHTQGPLVVVRHGADVAITLGPFERQGDAVTADPDCRSLLAWATGFVSN